MGNYFSASELIERMGKTTVDNLSGDYDGLEQIVFLERVIERAEGMVNGYAGRLYEIPLPKSYNISELTAKFAEFEMYKRGQGDDVPTKYKITDADWALLRDIANGLCIPEGAIKLRTTMGMSLDLSSDSPLMRQTDYNESDSDYTTDTSDTSFYSGGIYGND